MARAHWLAEREKELLPVPYFHVVFTLPQQIGRLALQNPRPIYSILFRAVSETLLTIAADPTRTFTVWCRVAVSLRTARVGSLPDARFSFR